MPKLSTLKPAIACDDHKPLQAVASGSGGGVVGVGGRRGQSALTRDPL